MDEKNTAKDAKPEGSAYAIFARFAVLS